MKKEDWDKMEKYVELTWQEAMERIAAGEPVMVLTALNPGAVTLEEFSAMTPVGPAFDEDEPVELEAPEPVEAGEQLEPVEESVEPVKVKEPEKKVGAASRAKIDEGKVFALRAAAKTAEFVFDKRRAAEALRSRKEKRK